MLPSLPAGSRLFVPADPSVESTAFNLATVLNTRTDGSLRVRTLEDSTTAGGVERIVRLGVDAWPVSEPGSSTQEDLAPSDLCELPFLHSPSLLHALGQRFERDAAFATWLGRDVLLWLHPHAPTPELWTARQKMLSATVSARA